MKKLVYVLMITIMSAGVAYAQNHSQKPARTSSVKFYETSYDFGQMAFGSTISHVFVFKNISGNPIAIKDVGTTCGCTTSGYSKEPVEPGKTGSITAKYDSSKLGAFNKTLTVLINDETIKIVIRGTVLPPKSESGQN